jgi:hypothetical protein
LEIHPKLGRHPKITSKPEGRFGADATLLVNDLAYAAYWNVQLSSQSIDTDSQRFQELFSQHCSWMNWWPFLVHRHAPSSVILDDFDIPSVPSLVLPDETDAPLLVNADAMLAGPITLQGFQAISRWGHQVFEPGGSVQHLQFALRNPRTVRSDCAGYTTLEQFLRLLALERGNHNFQFEYITLRVLLQAL